MQCSVEIRIKIRIETSFKLCSSTTLLISGATAGLVYARNGPLQQVEIVQQYVSAGIFIRDPAALVIITTDTF